MTKKWSDCVNHFLWRFCDLWINAFICSCIYFVQTRMKMFFSHHSWAYFFCLHHQLAVVTVGVRHPSCQPTALCWNMWQKTAPAASFFFFFFPSSIFWDLLKHVRPSSTRIDSVGHLDATWDSKHMLQSPIPRKAVRSTHTDRRRFHLCGLTWKKTRIRERPHFFFLLCF